jgi:hypothetical protein
MASMSELETTIQSVETVPSLTTDRPIIDLNVMGDDSFESSDNNNRPTLTDEIEHELNRPFSRWTVIKRDGSVAKVDLQHIYNRFDEMATTFQPSLKAVDLRMLTVIVAKSLIDKMTTADIEETAIRKAYSLYMRDTDYGVIAGRLAISNLQKCTEPNFYNVMKRGNDYIHPKKKSLGLKVVRKDYKIVSDLFMSNVEWLMNNGHDIESVINYQRDFLIDYIGFKTLEKGYLLKLGSAIVGRVQHLWMGLAIVIHGRDWDRVVRTYNDLSLLRYIHATPTLLNALMDLNQFASCFLLDAPEDSIHGIYKLIKQMAEISKSAGGIGASINKIRSSSTWISGTNGNSNGLAPMIKVIK